MQTFRARNYTCGTHPVTGKVYNPEPDSEAFCLRIKSGDRLINAYLSSSEFGVKEFGKRTTTPFVWIAPAAMVLMADSPAKDQYMRAMQARPVVEAGEIIKIEGFGEYKVIINHARNPQLVAVNGTSPETVAVY